MISSTLLACAAFIRGRRLLEGGLYSRKYGSRTFSRDPIFAERKYAKISRCNFRDVDGRSAVQVARMCVYAFISRI